MERGKSEALARKLSIKKEFGGIYRADGLQVVKKRIITSSKNSPNYFRDADALAYLRGERVELFSNKTNKSVGKGKMSPKYRRYVQSKIEVFADGYAQFRIDPKGFKKYAPQMYDYFVKVFN